MIEMVNVLSVGTFLKFAQTIITGILLSFQLNLYILSRNLPFKTFFESDMSLGACNTFLWISLIVSSLSCKFLFRVVFAIKCIYCAYFPWIVLAILPAPFLLLFPVFCIVPSTTGTFLFAVSFSIVLLSCVFSFQMPLGKSSASYSRCFLVSLAIVFSLFNVRGIVDFCLFCYALLAARFQFFASSMEEFRGSRKPLKALCALLLRGILRYSITHDRNYLSVVTAPVVDSNAGPKQYLFIPQVYHKQALEASLWSFCCHF